MTGKRDAALAWARAGFRVFPLQENSKFPTDIAWTRHATTDEATIRAWWTAPGLGHELNLNIGMLTSGWIVVDVDVKKGKPGLLTFAELGMDFDTKTTRTPTGGYHLIFQAIDRVVGGSPLGEGLDVRSENGYILAPGSTVSVLEEHDGARTFLGEVSQDKLRDALACGGRILEDVPYVVELDLPIAEFPEHLRSRLKSPRKQVDAAPVSVELDAPEAVEIAAHWLLRDAKIAVAGQNGNDTSYRVACRLVELGISETTALDLFLDEYNSRCEPPWDADEARTIVENAFRYAQNAPGSASPAAVFGDVIRIEAPPRAKTDTAADPGATPEAPLPLFHPLPPAERFPIEHLGQVLSLAAAAISRKVQVPEAMAGQSVLAAAALASQAHADVFMPYEQTRPTSLFLVSVAASGDRKSTADKEALRPITKHEKMLGENNKREMRDWRVAHAAWTAEKKKIERDLKVDFDSRTCQLKTLGDEPPRPLMPFLTTGDLTLEGLAKAWGDAHPALGIFTAEAGQFTGGHAMGKDNALKSAAMLSELWDGKPVRRVRALDGVTSLPGRRLSCHLLVQPEAAAEFLGNSTLRDQGLLSRMLVAAPESLAGTRLYRHVDPADEEAICAYEARVLSILEGKPTTIDGRNELDPRHLRLSAEADEAWRAFYDRVEHRCGGDLRPVVDFAAKAAEHAARIAGVMTIVGDAAASEIGVDAMVDALSLVNWYLDEALRLAQAGRLDPKLQRAATMLKWLQERGGSTEIEFRDVLRLGPGSLRTMAVANECIATLIAHHWLEETSVRPRRFRVIQEPAP